MSDLMKRLENLSPEKRELVLQKLRSQTADAPAKSDAQQLAIVPVARTAELPLSFAQQRLWFLYQLDSNSVAYNLSGAARLIGCLNVAALEQAITEIVNRHEVLRTTFPTRNRAPFQQIAAAQALSLPLLDLQHLPEPQQDAEVQQQIDAEAQQPFDLVQGSLLRVRLLKLAPQSHVLLITMHHIVSDGWSIGIFIRELSTLYSAFSQNQPSPLPALPIQYVDFAVWQRQWLQGETLATHLAYWKQQLSGAPPLLELPTDRPRPAIQTFRGAKHNLELSNALARELRGLSRQENVTLFMTMLAAFKVLLCSYTRQEEIVVGTPVAGRNRIETESLIGFFINTLVLRTNLADNPPFRALLSRVREITLGAFAHQSLPFEKLVEELQPQRNLSHNPLFQVWFNMLNLTKAPIQLPGLQVEPLIATEVESKFDLTLYVVEDGDRLTLQLVYNAELFAEARMVELLTQFEHLLQQLVAQPGTPIRDFSLVTPSAAPTLPDPTVPLQPEWQGSILDRFAAQTRRSPQQLAVVDSQITWSYAELHDRSNQLANYLLASGIQRGEVVAVYAHRSAALVWALLGILKAGAAFMILDATYPAARLMACLERVRPQGWLQLKAATALPSDLETAVSHLPLRCRLTLPLGTEASPDQLVQAAKTDPDLTIAAADLAYVAFTSGSTGKPKGIWGSHQPLSHFFEWYTQTFQLQPDDRFSVLSGLAHDPLLRDIFAPLWIGATLYIPDPQTIETAGQLASWMQHQQISIANLTPAMTQLLAVSTLAKGQVPLRYAFLGGDVLTQSDVRRLQQLAPAVTCVNFYGTTETPQAIAYLIVAALQAEAGDDSPRPLDQPLSIGHGIMGVQLLILKQGQRLAGIGEVGEICVRTPYLALGYVDEPALTATRFTSNPFTQLPGDRLYRTGDLGRYQPNGHVEFLGRGDRQVTLRGFRIELREIELALSQHPQVQKAWVSVRVKSATNKQLIAYIVSNAGTAIETAELRRFLQARLPHYLIPTAFVPLASLPLTPNGKIDELALPDPTVGSGEATPVISPQDELERQLINIWQSVLGIDSIQVTDNFFDLGGHSLQAVVLFAEIEKIFGKTLPLATLFQAATIQELASIIRQEDWLAPWSSLVPLQPHGSKPPLFLIHPGGGNLLIYRHLTQSFGNDQPVYGLQPVGLDGKSKILNRIEDMAAHYAAQIRSLQPEGPYHLGGLSTGGAIAWEIAQQLQQQNQSVGLLALFDTHGPGYPELLPPLQRLLSVLLWWTLDLGRRITRAPARLVNKVKQLKFQKLRLVKPSLDEDSVMRERLVQKQIQYKVQIFAEHANRINQLERWINHLIVFLLHYSSHPYYANTFATGLYRIALTQIPESIQQIQATTFTARRAYVQQGFSGRLTLFRASQRPPGIRRDPLLGWGNLAAQGIDTYTIPGNHVSIVYSPELAEKLKLVLEAVQQKAAATSASGCQNRLDHCK